MRACVRSSTAFAYPTYFLMLPMRGLRASAERRAARATASA